MYEQIIQWEIDSTVFQLCHQFHNERRAKKLANKADNTKEIHFGPRLR